MSSLSRRDFLRFLPRIVGISSIATISREKVDDELVQLEVSNNKIDLSTYEYRNGLYVKGENVPLSPFEHDSNVKYSSHLDTHIFNTAMHHIAHRMNVEDAQLQRFIDAHPLAITLSTPNSDVYGAGYFKSELNKDGIAEIRVTEDTMKYQLVSSTLSNHLPEDRRDFYKTILSQTVPHEIMHFIQEVKKFSPKVETAGNFVNGAIGGLAIETSRNLTKRLSKNQQLAWMFAGALAGFLLPSKAIDNLELHIMHADIDKLQPTIMEELSQLNLLNVFSFTPL